MCFDVVSGMLKCRTCLDTIGYQSREIELCEQAKTREGCKPCYQFMRETIFNTDVRDNAFLEMCPACLVVYGGQMQHEMEVDSVWGSEESLQGDDKMDVQYEVDSQVGPKRGASNAHSSISSDKSSRSSCSYSPGASQSSRSSNTTNSTDRILDNLNNRLDRRARIAQRRRNIRHRRRERIRQANETDTHFAIRSRSRARRRRANRDDFRDMVSQFSSVTLEPRYKVGKSRRPSVLKARAREQRMQHELTPPVAELNDASQTVGLNMNARTPILRPSDYGLDEDISDIEMI